jgi:hypothetical protein
MCLAPMVARWQGWIEQSPCSGRSKAAKAALSLASPDGVADPSHHLSPAQARCNLLGAQTGKSLFRLNRVLADLLFSIL